MAGNLKLFNILVADSDEQLGKVFHKTLEDMGFSNVVLASNGTRALEALQKKPFDLLITEWNLQKLNGMELINTVRRSANTPDPTLPIIMLTGRAEQNDVLAARDAGVNEYVIKPFSARTIYSRLERLIENPRNFVVSQHFVGPDRRGRNMPPPGIADQRKISVKPQLKPKTAASETSTIEVPKIWVVDYGMTRKLGKDKLSSLITPEILRAVQVAIDSITIESLKWIRDNLQALKLLHENLKGNADKVKLIERMGEEALNLSGRAGTFGYTNAAKVSYLLHLFCNNSAHVDQQIRFIVIEKHINVLQITLSPTPSKISRQDTTIIIHELEQLAKKFTSQAT